MASNTDQDLQTKFIRDAIQGEPAIINIATAPLQGKSHAQQHLTRTISGTAENIVSGLVRAHKEYQMQITAATNRLTDMGMEANDASALVARLEEVAKRTSVEADSAGRISDIPAVQAAKARLLTDPSFGRDKSSGPTDYVEIAHSTKGLDGRGRW